MWMDHGQQNKNGDAWGDDSDDELLMYATQTLEEEEIKQQQQKPKGPAGQGLGGGPSLSPTAANQALHMRRQQLEETQDSEPFQLSESMSQSHDAQALIKHLQSKVEAEKIRAQKLQTDLMKAQGESGILRSKVETLKHTQQEELINRMKRERDEKQKSLEEIQKLKKEITNLNTRLRLSDDEMANIKSKLAMKSPSGGRLSVGGAQGPRQNVPFSQPTTSSTSARFRSDPNLSAQQPKTSSLAVRSVSTAPAQPEYKIPKIQVADKSIEADATLAECERRDELIFGKAEDEINVGKFESVTCMEILSKRQDIFLKLQSQMSYDFLEISPTLESIVDQAPNEIMVRFVRGVEVKTCFPDVVNSVFQCGIAAQRKKEKEEEGETVEVKYPTLPSIFNPAIIKFDQFLPVLEKEFVHGSAWSALRQLKAQLKKLLVGLEGDLRFRLYEITNLQTLWKLLAWTKTMWTFILFEEELDGVVELHGGKKIWTHELREWTGLILKIDWRDFYVAELETLVRQFSLSILESIVTSGYFEQLQRRYEILYCILKDTLVKDHHRSPRVIKNCLAIITWSVADRTIFSYLCLNNNDDTNCLARLLGENVLTCFRASKNPYSCASILVYYLNLLETLMIEKPFYYFASKIARPNQNYATAVQKQEQNSDEEDEDGEQMEAEIDDGAVGVDMVEDMEVDLMQSQFACPEKYKFDDASKERSLTFGKTADIVPCWISPKQWEVTGFESVEIKPCQCRKIFFGSAFIMLHSVMQFWKESFLKNEHNIDELENVDREELQRLIEALEKAQDKSGAEYMENKKNMQYLSEKLKSLQNFMIECLTDAKNDKDDYKVAGYEWTWDEIWKGRRLKNEKLKESKPENSKGIIKLEPFWAEEKRRPDNVFDYLLRVGVPLMNFCYFENSNMAAAIGSEAFHCFTLLSSEFRYYIDNMRVTPAERTLIAEFTPLEDESEESLEDSKSTSAFGDDDSVSSINLLPEFDPALILKDLPLKRPVIFSEEEFDRSFKLLEQEMKM